VRQGPIVVTKTRTLPVSPQHIHQSTSFASSYLAESSRIIELIDKDSIEHLVESIALLSRNKGRIFFLGVGGSAANCSHAVNDFRKICGIECYSPADNVSELTARTNDEGWDTIFSEWLKISRISNTDAVFVFSVGGGNSASNISPNIVKAVDFAKSVGAKVWGVVGRDGGHTKVAGDSVVLIPTVSPATITPHTEAFQAVIWHLLVSHPSLQLNQTKWESVNNEVQ